MSLELLSKPLYEPVSVLEALRWLRLEDDDTANLPVVRLLIKAMREMAENLTHRAFVPRRYRLSLMEWPCDPCFGYSIPLPFPPLISVESVKYIATDGVLTTLDEASYVVHTEREPGIIVPAWLTAWPAVRATPNSLQVEFTAGYSPTSPDDEAGYQAALPETLKLWMEAKVATHNELREQIVVGNLVTALPRDFTDSLLDPLIIGSRLF